MHQLLRADHPVAQRTTFTVALAVAALGLFFLLADDASASHFDDGVLAWDAENGVLDGELRYACDWAYTDCAEAAPPIGTIVQQSGAELVFGDGTTMPSETWQMRLTATQNDILAFNLETASGAAITHTFQDGALQSVALYTACNDWDGRCDAAVVRVENVPASMEELSAACGDLCRTFVAPLTNVQERVRKDEAQSCETCIVMDESLPEPTDSLQSALTTESILETSSPSPDHHPEVCGEETSVTMAILPAPVSSETGCLQDLLTQ